jgi:hypothetical protein
MSTFHLYSSILFDFVARFLPKFDQMAGDPLQVDVFGNVGHYRLAKSNMRTLRPHIKAGSSYGPSIHIAVWILRFGVVAAGRAWFDMRAGVVTGKLALDAPRSFEVAAALAFVIDVELRRGFGQAAERNAGAAGGKRSNDGHFSKPFR